MSGRCGVAPPVKPAAHSPWAEWIVDKRGSFWRAAKSVANKESARPWIPLHLSGERPLAPATQLSFRYRISGATTLNVALVNAKTGATYIVELKGLRTGDWTEATADFILPRAGRRIDEVRFLLAARAELLIDDGLLYEPGEK